MLAINFPPPDFQIKTEKGREFIFDIQRKKWLLLTPEEWVRQNFVRYLVHEMKYPAALIALEKEIMLGELKKRFDILVYNREHVPWLMIECKSADVRLNSDVLQQVLRYNISVPVLYVIITNGNETAGWEKKDGTLIELKELPVFA